MPLGVGRFRPSVFGRGKHREEQLRASGRAARAEVLEAERSGLGVTVGNPALVDGTEVVWKLRLLVQPEGEPPFEASLKARLPQLNVLRRGASLAVLYDPADHSRVVLDRSEQGIVDAALSSALAGNPAVAADPRVGDQLGELMREAIADPAAFRQKMQQQASAGINPLTGAGPLSGGGLDSAPLSGGGRGSGHAPPADPLDQLAKLADLRDRGALTDEEFQTQKRRILGD